MGFRSEGEGGGEGRGGEGRSNRSMSDGFVRVGSILMRRAIPSSFITNQCQPNQSLPTSLANFSKIV